MKRIRRFWRDHWQLLVLVAVCVAAVAWLMLYRLGSLTGGLSSMELQLQVSSSVWHNIVHDPLNLPLKAVQWVFLTTFSHHGQTITRLPSALFGALSIGLFAYILRRWYGVRTAVLGSILFAFSGTFLHAARLASFDIMYLWGVLMLIALHIALERAAKPQTLVAILALTALVLYIPGMIWLVLFDYIWQWRTLREKWLAVQWRPRIAIILVFAAMVALLGWAMWQAPELLRTWLGLPSHFASPLTIVHELVKVPWYVFVRQPLDGQTWLNGLPVLDIFSSVMFGLGAYFYFRHWRAPRSRLLLGYIILGAVLVAIGGPVTLSNIVPILYVVMVAGVAYLLHEWLRVFPLNPLARWTGILVLAAVIVTVCTYHARAYFVAWPHTSQAITLFHNLS